MPTPQVWNGSSWVPVTKTKFGYYNGSTFVEPSDVKVWNGSTWETIFPPTGVALRTTNTNTQNSVNSLAVGIPGTVQTGDLLVLVVGQSSFATPLFNAISGWTKAGEQRASTSGFTLGVFTRLAQGGDAGGTVTSTSVNSENYTGHLRVYSGVNQSTPLDASVVFAQSSAAVLSSDAPAITVVTTGAMLVTMYGVPTTTNTTLSATDWTDPSGFSDELTTCSTSTSNNAALATYNRITPGTGSQGPFTATITQSRRWATATLAIRPA